MTSTHPKTYESSTPRKVAFLGLGVMGYPMAGHLALAGHQVTVYNRSSARAQAWCGEFKGLSAASPREAASSTDIVFCCVGNDDDLRAVTLGKDGAFAGMKAGAILADHTTASADVARELHGAARQLGLQFVDAPVSGGQAGAQNGALTVMCGGDAAAFDTVKPAGMAFSKAFTLMGAVDGKSPKHDHRDRIWHVAPESSRRRIGCNGAGRQRVEGDRLICVADHKGA